jgi:hypothetical protein
MGITKHYQLLEAEATYEVWMTQGQGNLLVETFKDMQRAFDKVEELEGQGSFGVKKFYADGQTFWFDWDREIFE